MALAFCTVIQESASPVFIPMTSPTTEPEAGPRSHLSAEKLNALPEQLWFNALWFQLTWFSAVLGRDDWIYLSAAMIALHIALVANRIAECYRLLLLALLGIATDSVLSYSGVFLFDSGGPVPLWLCSLWLAFATTLTRSLKFLQDRLWLSSLLGAIVVPFNYGVGERLGAVEFGYALTPTMALLALVWALLLPLLSWAAGRLKQYDARQVTP